jgi:hypothetical protein
VLLTRGRASPLLHPGPTAALCAKGLAAASLLIVASLNTVGARQIGLHSAVSEPLAALEIGTESRRRRPSWRWRRHGTGQRDPAGLPLAFAAAHTPTAFASKGLGAASLLMVA